MCTHLEIVFLGFIIRLRSLAMLEKRPVGTVPVPESFFIKTDRLGSSQNGFPALDEFWSAFWNAAALYLPRLEFVFLKQPHTFCRDTSHHHHFRHGHVQSAFWLFFPFCPSVHVQARFCKSPSNIPYPWLSPRIQFTALHVRLTCLNFQQVLRTLNVPCLLSPSLS